MPWLLLNSGRCAPAENMAWDEALLEGVASLRQPVLRFYGWTEPAATFGYFQKFAEVSAMTNLRPLIRRPTGGGLVPHDTDWTYSLVFPPGDPWYELKATDSYRRVHEWIRETFGSLGIKTDLSPCCRKEVPGQCFIGAEQFDVLHADRKIAGAAQRRTRDGLLIQGSIQPPEGTSREAFEGAFCRVASAKWRVEWQPLPQDLKLARRAQTLSSEKFASREFNERR